MTDCIKNGIEPNVEQSVANLLVIPNAVSSDIIKATFPNHTLITDGDIFCYLNNKPFNGKTFSIDTIEELCTEFVNLCANGSLIIVHSFNPLVHNYLACPFDPQSQMDSANTTQNHFLDDMEATKSRFIAYTDKAKVPFFFSLLDIKLVWKKMESLAIGEAICDVYLENEISKAEHLMPIINAVID